jgi:hypothetical protein
MLAVPAVTHLVYLASQSIRLHSLRGTKMPIGLRRLLKIALIPIALLVAIELILQLGALIAKSTIRDTPEGWSTQNFRVLAVGDSNTFGLYLEENESYPAQLEELWNKQHPERPIEVVNVGYPGITSFRAAANIDKLMETFSPEVVLLSIGVNDMFTAAEYLESDTASGEQVSPGSIRALLRRYSRLYKFIYMTRQGVKDKEGNPTQSADAKVQDRDILQWSDDETERLERIKKFKKANSGGSGKQDRLTESISLGDKKIVMVSAEENSSGPDTQRGFDYIQKNVDSIRKRVEQDGAKMYFLTYLASESFYRVANEETRKYAVQNPQANFIDVETAFKSQCSKRKHCPQIFFQDYHPKAPGYTKVAAYVADRLDKDGVVNR